ncbi:hypothetical protein [Herbiconiux sp. L3-i23]|uniref:hypothetical protein n=1 Tax=Herbiconiux sp. L3-i23 TaxID=2905871 RepID=UPI002065C61E|nr:hypothetical protein [Herbiconiux sp. L3-i23]BDI23545.1 hypothetical protein L3i23_23210 [Herbiconiux sp. L3-i23]
MSTILQAAPEAAQAPSGGRLNRLGAYTPSPAEIEHAARFRDYTVEYRPIRGRSITHHEDGFSRIGQISVDHDARLFKLYPYPHATTVDVRQMERTVAAIRSGYWGALPWQTSETGTQWATVAVRTSARRESEWPEVRVCKVESCQHFREWHRVDDEGSVRHFAVGADEPEGSPWQVGLQRTDDGPWQVSIDYAPDRPLTELEVAGLLSRIRWVAEDARRLNSPAVQEVPC